jgi:FtsH-binding integral membrane protein
MEMAATESKAKVSGPYQVVGQEDEDFEELVGLGRLEEAPSLAGTDEFAGLPVHMVPQEIRNAFVRKVFSIVGLQLLLTVAIAAPLVCVESVRASLAGGNPLLLGLSMVGSFGTLCALLGSPGLARSFPTNVGMLAMFTVFESILVAMVVSLYELTSVLLGVFVTAMVVLGVTAYAANTSRDFTSPRLGCVSSLWYFVLSGFLLLFFPQIPVLTKMCAVGGSVLFCAFLVFDVQRIIGGAHHKHQFSVDDYVLAALTVYLDVINIFLYVLEILGSRRD